MSVLRIRKRMFYILSFVVFEALATACPPGWLTWQDSCYILLPDRMDWFKASKACDRPGTSMIVPNSQAEQDFVWREMQQIIHAFDFITDTTDIWTGCRNADYAGHLMCSGEESDPVYKNWGNGDPNEATGYCLRMTEAYGGQWADTGCSNIKFVVCEMKVQSDVCRPSSTRYIHVSQQCLLNHEIKSHPVNAPIGCGLACRAEPLCRSFNIRKVGDNKICQLNYATRLEADVTDIKQDENCYIYEP